jgi:tetratricopeptide (TPR) repeat protein
MGARWLWLPLLLLALASASPAQPWYSVQTSHLISYSEGNDRGAREAALRGEQLIAVYAEIFHRNPIVLATPLRVLAMAAPAGMAMLVRTPAANYVLVDPAQPDSWTQAARVIAGLILDDNYPRAQPWFDSGIASYLAGVRFTGDSMELGAAPRAMAAPEAETWIPVARLLAIDDPARLSAMQRASFETESWALVRWLIGSSRLAQAGTYLSAVQWRGATPEQAMAEAFSLDPAGLDREVRASLGNLAAKKMFAPRVEYGLFKAQKVSAADAHAIRSSLSLFGPEGDRALDELVAFMRLNQENAAVHRWLAWAFLLRHDLDHAVEHIRRALALDDSDPSMHDLYARWVNQGEENSIRVESAETRMGTELKIALQRDPNYAAARELLGLAELSDQHWKAALADLQRASALCPRNNRYYLNLARAYEAADNLDGARSLAVYAGAGSDEAVSAEASELLNELGKEKKQRQQWEAMGIQTGTSAKPGKYDNLQEAIAADERAEATKQSPEKPPETGKIELMKGRIVSVECGETLEAMLIVSSGGRTWRIHVGDRNAAVLIGVGQFDCGWHDIAVSINYRRSGELQGELVSLEAD